MVGSTSKKSLAHLVEELSKKTHFTKHECQCLLKLYEEHAPLKMDRNKFRDFLHQTFDMTDDILMDRVFRAFDKDNDSNINMEEWVNGLSVFLRGEEEEKIEYCFVVYDLNSDRFITREEMFHMLKQSLIKTPNEEDPDEGVKDIVEIALKKMDADKDNKVSFNDYKTSVLQEPLLLEAFGQCLPDAKKIKSFCDKMFCTTQT